MHTRNLNLLIIKINHIMSLIQSYLIHKMDNYLSSSKNNSLKTKLKMNQNKVY